MQFEADARIRNTSPEILHCHADQCIHVDLGHSGGENHIRLVQQEFRKRKNDFAGPDREPDFAARQAAQVDHPDAVFLPQIFQPDLLLNVIDAEPVVAAGIGLADDDVIA